MIMIMCWNVSFTMRAKGLIVSIRLCSDPAFAMYRRPETVIPSGSKKTFLGDVRQFYEADGRSLAIIGPGGSIIRVASPHLTVADDDRADI